MVSVGGKHWYLIATDEHVPGRHQPLCLDFLTERGEGAWFIALSLPADGEAFWDMVPLEGRRSAYHSLLLSPRTQGVRDVWGVVQTRGLLLLTRANGT